MTIMTEDGNKIVGVGSSMILHSLYSTSKIRVKMSSLRVGVALGFLKTGECKKNKVEKAVEQLKLIKAELLEHEPTEAVYDYRDLTVEVPWKNNINKDVYSCVELYTTDNGSILIDELIELLEYACENQLSVVLP